METPLIYNFPAPPGALVSCVPAPQTNLGSGQLPLLDSFQWNVIMIPYDAIKFNHQNNSVYKRVQTACSIQHEFLVQTLHLTHALRQPHPPSWVIHG